MPQQHCYAGLDVSLEQTSVCVLDEAGSVGWRGKSASEPESISAALRKFAPGAVRIALETGLLSTWLFHELKKQDLPVICIPGEDVLRDWRGRRSSMPIRRSGSSRAGRAAVDIAGMKKTQQPIIGTLERATDECCDVRPSHQPVPRDDPKDFNIIDGQAKRGRLRCTAEPRSAHLSTAAVCISSSYSSADRAISEVGLRI
jgi:hypothetical protein